MEVWVREQQVSGIFSFDVMCDASTEDLDSYEEFSESCILIRGIPDAVSESDIKSYFGDAQQSGGGPFREVHFDRLRKCAVIHFTNEADARKVLSQQHNLRGRTLTVMAYDQNLKCPVYRDRLLFGAKHPSTTGEDLCSFLEKLVGIDTVECVFGEDSEKAVVTFRTPPEVERLRSGCGETKLHDRYLEVKRVPVSSCIMVENVNANTTKEVIKVHFENSSNGGGAINTITDKKDGDYVLIYFEDFETAVSVEARSHRLDKRDLDISIYYDSLGRGQKQATFTLPLPVVMDSVDTDIFRFIQSLKFEMSSLENKMKDCNTTIRWPCKQTCTVALECGLSPKVKDYRNRASKWRAEAQSKFGDATKRFSKFQCEVRPDLMDGLMQELSTTNVSNPEKVMVYHMPGTNVLKVVGYTGNVNEVHGVLQKTIEKVVNENTIHSRAEPIEPHILQLLLVTNWMNTVEAKYKGISVFCHAQKHQVCLQGTRNAVEDIHKELLKFVNAVQSQVVSDIDEYCLPLYSNQEVKDYIAQKLKTARLGVVYKVCKNNLYVYITDKKMLPSGIKIIKESVRVTLSHGILVSSDIIDHLKLMYKDRLIVTRLPYLFLPTFYKYRIVSTDNIHREIVDAVIGKT